MFVTGHEMVSSLVIPNQGPYRGVHLLLPGATSKDFREAQLII